jgi:hypothetical protein
MTSLNVQNSQRQALLQSRLLTLAEKYTWEQEHNQSNPVATQQIQILQ